MSQLTVLQLDGRRQNVKITPHTTISEILDQVCQKIGLSPEEYDLKHHRKILDVSSTVQFCGLPQHAQLELVATKQPRVLSEVTLCLQLETGARLNGNFHPTSNLWEVLKKTVPDLADTYQNPVIVYARREIIGPENLRNTTLRNIGLVGGRAIVRLINKSLTASQRPSDKSERCENTAKTLPTSMETISSKTEPTDGKIDVSSESLEGKSSGNEPKEVIPGAEPMKLEPKIDEKQIGHAKLKDRPLEEKFDVVSESTEEPMEVSEPSEPVDDLERKRARVHSPEPPQEIQFEKVNLLGTRNAVAYNLDMIPPTIVEDLPDEFYELNIRDVKTLAAASRRALKDIEDAPLLTAQQRQLDQDGITLQKLAQYHSCVVRIRFPDRSVLQGSFKPIEIVQDIYNFVMEYLSNSSMDFHLYTTPPKTILKREDRLVEANCVPSVNLYFGTNEPLSSAYLKPNVVNQFSTHSAANQTVFQSRPINSAIKCETLKSTEQKEAEASSSDSYGGKDEPPKKVNSKSSSNVVPKWLKLSK